MICDDVGGGKEKTLSSDGRSFQRRGAGLDMALSEKVRCEATGCRERVRQEDYRLERVGLMEKNSRRYTYLLGVLDGVVG